MYFPPVDVDIWSIRTACCHMPVQWLRPCGHKCDNHHSMVHLKDESDVVQCVIERRKKKRKKTWLCHQKILTNMHQARTVLPSCFRTSTDCLSDYRDTLPLCRGGCAPPAYYHTVWALNHPCVCVCLCVIEIEIEKAVVFKRNIGIICKRLHEQTKEPVFAYP